MAQGVWRQYFGIAGGPSGTGCLAEWVCSERTATQFAVNMPPSSRLWRSNSVRLPFVVGADWSRLKRTRFLF